MLSLASGTQTRLKSLGLYGLRWLTSGHRRLSLSKLGPLAGAKEVVLTIGLSFKHAQPWKEPPHGRIRLLGDLPASDAAGEGSQGSASSGAKARGQGTEGRDGFLPLPRCGQLCWSAVPSGSQGFCCTRTPATWPPQTRGDLSPHPPGPG